MTRKEALELFPKFRVLQGTFSEKHKKSIECVFITLKEINLTHLTYQALKRGGGFPTLDGEENDFTIAVVLEGGRQIVSIIDVLSQATHPDLIQDAERLDRIRGCMQISYPEQDASVDEAVQG